MPPLAEASRTSRHTNVLEVLGKVYFRSTSQQPRVFDTSYESRSYSNTNVQLSIQDVYDRTVDRMRKIQRH